MRAFCLSATALILLIAISGCGSDSSGEAAAERAPRLSKAELLKKGSAICDHGNSVIGTQFNHLSRVDAAAGRVATHHELNERAARVVLPVRKAELRRLRALGMPAEGTRQFQTMLAASEVGIRFGLVSCWLQ